MHQTGTLLFLLRKNADVQVDENPGHFDTQQDLHHSTVRTPAC